MYNKIKDYLNNIMQKKENQESMDHRNNAFKIPKSIYQSFLKHATKLKKILTPKI